MSDRPAFISISLPPILRERLEERLEGSDFGNVSEYLRSLVRADLARFDYEKLVKRRLGRAGEGEAAISEEEAEAYLAAKARGENPAFAPAFHDRASLEAALLAGLNSGEEEVTPEYQARLDQEVGDSIRRSTNN